MVVAADDPAAACSTGVRALPAIVSVLERERARARYGVTVEGVPVELVIAAPKRFGTELLRATGSPGYVAALEPLPDAPDEEGVYRELEIPFVPPELREAPFRGEPPAARRARRRPRRPALPHDLVRRNARASRRWGSQRSSWATSTSRSATTRRRSVRCAGLTADDLRRQAIEIADANEALAPFRVLRGTECDILPDGRLDLPDDPRRARLGAGQRPRRAAAAEGEADRAGRAGAPEPVRVLPLAPEGAVHQPAPRERAGHRPADRGCARGGRRARGERPAGPARPAATSTCARRSRPA